MNDLRLAIRQLFSNPGFAVVAILTLALGIGANSAIFSVLNAVVLNPLPYPDANRIVFIGQSRDRQAGQMPVAYPDYLEWRAQVRELQDLTWIAGRNMTLTGADEPATLRVAAATAGLWPLLAVAPALGTTFGADHDRPGADPVCVLSHASWVKRFGSDPSIVGRSIVLDDRAYTVLGVMPPAFKFWAADAWLPAGLEAGSEQMRSRVMREDHWVVGRLRQDASVDTALRELDLVSARLAAAFPETNKGVGASMMLLRDSVGAALRPILLLLFGAVSCVLLIACVNVANLLLTRSASREREFSVRVALGASPARMRRLLFLENLPLALLGGAAGVLFAQLLLQALLYLLPGDAVPSEAQIRIDGPVLAFALLLSLGTTLAFGVIAAIGRSSTVSSEALRTGAGGTANRRTRRLRNGLIVAEVALAMTLLIGAGLLMRSLDSLQHTNPGFDASSLLVVPVNLTEQRYASAAQATQFFDELVQRAGTLPGVSAVAASTNVPLMGGSNFPLVTEGRSYNSIDELEMVQFYMLMGDYFRAQGIQLVAGRGFNAQDDASGAPVVVLNQAAARHFLGSEDVLGKRVMLGAPAHLIKPGMLPPGLDTFEWATIVGVAADVRHFGVQNEAPPAAYIPIAQSWEVARFRRSMSLLLRTDGDPLAVAAAVREMLWSIDRNQPIERITTMQAVIHDALGQSRFNTVLLGAFAGLALLLSAIGIYGIVAWQVAQRARELGIRMALGARRDEMLRMVVLQGMRVVLIGAGIGLVAAIVAATVFDRVMVQLAPADTWVFVLVPAALIAVALFACWLPARRAAAVDPLRALRAE
jgi:putative ABC transport system permease protein